MRKASPTRRMNVRLPTALLPAAPALWTGARLEHAIPAPHLPQWALSADWDSTVLIVLGTLGLTFGALVVWEALQRVLKLRREAQAEHERAVFLAEAGEEFARLIDLDTLLELVCCKAIHVMGDAGVIYLWDEESEELRVACALEKEPRTGRSLTPLLARRPSAPEQDLHYRVARTGEPELVPEFASSPYAQSYDVGVLGIRATLAVPLNVGERVLGVLVIHYFTDGEQPTEADLRLAVLLADRAAIGLEHARLYRRMEQLVDERTRELREAHAQLLETERAQAIAELAAMVAHEVRNPLHVVRTTTFALHQRLYGQEPRTDRHLDALDRNVEAAARIIQDLMDYGAFPEPEMAMVDLREVVEDVAPGIPHPDEVEIRTEITDEPLPVCLDRTQVQRAIKALIVNGVQAHDHPGLVILRVERRGSQAMVEVRDTGRGVPEGDRPHLFKPLFSTKIKGSGLGLALARRIFDANGGTLTFDEASGNGTVFRGSLPLRLRNRDGELAATVEADTDEEGEGVPPGSVQAKDRE